jgi:hypothetical protein
MIDVFEEKEKLTHELSEQYSRSIISLEEYEKMIDSVNKVESVRELRAVQKMALNNSDLSLPGDNSQKHVTVFSWRSATPEPVNGNAGRYVCVFGTNQIKVNDLPKGRTFLHVDSIFGLTEIFVSKKIKLINNVIPVMSGIFTSNAAENTDGNSPELHLTGKAVFGNITIIRTD